MSLDTSLREQLAQNLRAGNAHMSFEDAVAQFPEAHINTRPENVDYSFWHLVEHLRLTQADILRYITDPGYQEMTWPRDYWPAKDAQATKAEWDASVAAFLSDRDALAVMHEQYLTCGVTARDDTTYLRRFEPAFTAERPRW